MMRKPAAPMDHRIFSNTAKRTKDINLGVRVYRGGIRL